MEEALFAIRIPAIYKLQQHRHMPVINMELAVFRSLKKKPQNRSYDVVVVLKAHGCRQAHVPWHGTGTLTHPAANTDQESPLVQRGDTGM